MDNFACISFDFANNNQNKTTTHNNEGEVCQDNCVFLLLVEYLHIRGKCVLCLNGNCLVQALHVIS